MRAKALLSGWNLLVAALGCWLFSFVLPAHAEYGFGFHCFAWSLLVGVYPRLSVATNLLPLVALVSIVANWKAFWHEGALGKRWSNISSWVAVLSVAAIFLNLFWLVYRVQVGFASPEYISFAGSLRIGYYLWALSFVPLALGILRQSEVPTRH